ncbi:SGNH hydrolase, partial [Aspergillus steynii IBT 23096]
TDFRWIKRWAALGDSFSAGIGAGNLYTSARGDDWKCSRYDRSYPARLEKVLGTGPNFFQYLACSGDRTEQIYSQALNMEADMDFVVLTGGGNDLCLSDIVKTCVLLPLKSEAKCDEALRIAEDNLHFMLKRNVREVLEALDSKMHKNGLVLYVLYAQFFNADIEKCGLDQDWNLLPFGNSLPLTRERREKFNSLVERTNGVLREAIKEVQRGKKIRYRVRAVDWNDWARHGVRGQYCYPGTKGTYPDPGQPDLQFFKGNTYRLPKKDGHDELRRVKRQAPIEEPSFHDTLAYKSANPAAQAMNHLDSRAPLPPGCPSDGGGFLEWLGLDFGVPDNIGKFFHPNELGHTTIASFVLQEMYNARAEDLGTFNPTCENFDRFECHKQGDKLFEYYADVDQAVSAMKKFCENPSTADEIGEPVRNKHFKNVYYEFTPDQMMFEIGIVRAKEESFHDRDQCLDSFSRIIHGCDGLDPENPLNFKYGGSWIRGNYIYKLTMGGKDIKRNEVVPKKVSGSCTYKKTSKGLEYEVKGSAFANWDFGHHTIMQEVSNCAGGTQNISHWAWTYWPYPVDGYDWRVRYIVP